MQRYTIFFISVNAVHVSGGFSAHHQELKIQNSKHIWYMSSLLAVTASVGELTMVISRGNVIMCCLVRAVDECGGMVEW
jgi:hypothetical protein